MLTAGESADKRQELGMGSWGNSANSRLSGSLLEHEKGSL